MLLRSVIMHVDVCLLTILLFVFIFFFSGIRFALLQIKIGIISFLRSHGVQVSNKTVHPIKFSRRSLVTTSESGFWLNITSEPDNS